MDILKVLNYGINIDVQIYYLIYTKETRIMKKSVLLILVGIFLLTLPLTAGVYIKSVDMHVSDNKENTSEIFIEKDRIRIQMDRTEEYSVIIFRQDKQVMWMINESKKEYMALTKEDLEKFKKQMDNAQNMMSEQLKNLPPEQREMMEKMMQSQMQQMASAEKPKIEYKKAGQEKIDQWQCTKYEGYIDGTKKNDIWAASWSTIGFSAEDFQGLKHMGEFFEVLNQEVEEFYNLETFQGLPVQTNDYEEGKLVMKTRIKEITSKNSDASLFELPSGFTKKDLPMGNPGAMEMK
jgi:hypothetical protein